MHTLAQLKAGQLAGITRLDLSCGLTEFPEEIFALADSAFAFACNSYNQNTVAQHCSVTFLRPSFEGDRLTASAREVSRIGRGGIYDIKVTNQNGEHVAEFRGHSRTVKGTPIAAPG